MTPRDQLRNMAEQDEKHWYRLANSVSVGELRQRQDVMLRNPMALNPHVLSHTQQRLQLEPHFMHRELVPPTDMMSSESRPLAPPLPPHSAVLTGRAFSSGVQFLPPDSLETVARRQEILHKQNMARMEMNAILQQKELENQQRTMEGPLVYQHVYRARQRLHGNHDLHANSFLMSSPYPPIGTPQRERGRRPGRRAANQKVSDSVDEGPGGASGEQKQQEPEPEGRVGVGGEANANAKHQLTERKSFLSEVCVSAQTDGSRAGVANGNKDMDRFLFPPTTALSAFPYMFPMGGDTLLPPTHSNMLLNPDEVAVVEDLSKWTVEDVSKFISNIPSCSEHAQIFKDHMIDGETLPLLTENHLLDTLGLKLGPALKIRSQVFRWMGGALHITAPPLTAPPLQTPLQKRERSCDVISSLTHGTELIQGPGADQCQTLRPPAGDTPISTSDST